MKLWKIIALCSVLSVLSISLVQAATMQGAGVRTCSEFLQEYKAKPSEIEPLYFAWAQGFMGGLKVGKLNDENDDYSKMSFEEQETHIRTFCAANPAKKYLYAVIDLYNTLYSTTNTK